MSNAAVRKCENCGSEYDASQFPFVVCKDCSQKYSNYWLSMVYVNLYGNIDYDPMKYEQMKDLINLIPIRSIEEEPFSDIKEQTRSCKDCNKDYLANNDWPYEICIQCALDKKEKMRAIIEDEFSYGDCDFVNPIAASMARSIKLDRIKDGNVKNQMTKEDAARIQKHSDKNDGINEDFKRRAQAAADKREVN